MSQSEDQSKAPNPSFLPANFMLSPTQEVVDNENDNEDDLECSMDSNESIPLGQSTPKTQAKSTIISQDPSKEDEEDEVLITCVIDAPKIAEELNDKEEEGFSLSKNELKKIEKNRK